MLCSYSKKDLKESDGMNLGGFEDKIYIFKTFEKI